MEEKELREKVNTLVDSFFKPQPRLVCICGNFKADYPDLKFGWVRCECGGWVTMKRLREQNQ